MKLLDGNKVKKDRLEKLTKSVKDLKSLKLSDYEYMIYTSADPSHHLDKENVHAYLDKNLRSIYYILESDFQGSMIYISSVDAYIKSLAFRNSIFLSILYFRMF